MTQPSLSRRKIVLGASAGVAAMTALPAFLVRPAPAAAVVPAAPALKTAPGANALASGWW